MASAPAPSHVPTCAPLFPLSLVTFPGHSPQPPLLRPRSGGSCPSLSFRLTFPLVPSGCDALRLPLCDLRPPPRPPTHLLCASPAHHCAPHHASSLQGIQGYLTLPSVMLSLQPILHPVQRTLRAPLLDFTRLSPLAHLHFSTASRSTTSSSSCLEGLEGRDDLDVHSSRRDRTRDPLARDRTTTRSIRFLNLSFRRA